jgi:NAD(P)-dependent dehydrogenase (short-subunit alcohol dehydrogenase family)
VVLADSDADELSAAAASLEATAGPEVLALECDVTDEASVEQCFATATERLGVPRSIVTSAGIDRGGAAHELEVGAWDSLIAVNLRGAFLTCRAALGGLLDGGGAIVCISSPFAVASAPGTAGYSASKGGLSALVRSMAVDYGGHGIRVNAVLPGPTETELMWANVAEGDRAAVRATIEREVPLGRLADPDEPARAALWLLSPAASYVTGSELACDGGVLAKSSVSV